MGNGDLQTNQTYYDNEKVFNSIKTRCKSVLGHRMCEEESSEDSLILEPLHVRKSDGP